MAVCCETHHHFKKNVKRFGFNITQLYNINVKFNNLNVKNYVKEKEDRPFRG